MVRYFYLARHAVANGKVASPFPPPGGEVSTMPCISNQVAPEAFKVVPSQKSFSSQDHPLQKSISREPCKKERLPTPSCRAHCHVG